MALILNKTRKKGESGTCSAFRTFSPHVAVNFPAPVPSTWTSACSRRPATGARTLSPCLRSATSSSGPFWPPWCPQCRPWCPAASWTGYRWATAWRRPPSPCGWASGPCPAAWRSTRVCCAQTAAWAPCWWWSPSAGARGCTAPGPGSVWPGTLFPGPPRPPRPGRSAAAPGSKWRSRSSWWTWVNAPVPTVKRLLSNLTYEYVLSSKVRSSIVQENGRNII